MLCFILSNDVSIQTWAFHGYSAKAIKLLHAIQIYWNNFSSLYLLPCLLLSLLIFPWTLLVADSLVTCCAALVVRWEPQSQQHRQSVTKKAIKRQKEPLGPFVPRLLFPIFLAKLLITPCKDKKKVSWLFGFSGKTPHRKERWFLQGISAEEVGNTAKVSGLGKENQNLFLKKKKKKSLQSNKSQKPVSGLANSNIACH